MKTERRALPFRLGSTSYVIPDDILPNVRHLSDLVDDIELVLFESDECSNLPPPQSVAEMKQAAEDAGLTYTVHLPLDTRLGSASEGERSASVAKCRRVFDLMAPLAPLAWILHLHGDRRGSRPTDDPARWLDRNRRSLSELLSEVASRRVCVETLDYDLEWTGLPGPAAGDRGRGVAGIIEDHDLSVCIDVGHLLVAGRDVGACVDRWMDRARVFHVHGVRPGGRDHADLGALPPGLLEDLAHRLSRCTDGHVRVVTMEVFGEDDFVRSMRVVRERLSAWLS
jgi:sugar phosphate isomerase/epimerase